MRVGTLASANGLPAAPWVQPIRSAAPIADRIVPGNLEESPVPVWTAVSGPAAVALENVCRLSLHESGREASPAADLDHGMVGRSPALCETLRLIRRVAPADATVLLLGESGTGKELAARAIHDHGPRAPKPFVAINCAALTESLLESELFGHERGAFTGALTQKRGKLELADGGTVFLDEIGEMVPALQAKLLRVLQERELVRVGGTRTIPINARVIAATNCDLARAVQAGSFRQDLFYRLNVVVITMPPLRERCGDIPLLASYFLRKFGRGNPARHVRGISRQACCALENYRWPGNVRELENAIEQAVVLGAGDMIELEDLPEALREFSPAAAPPDEYHAAVDHARRQIILRSLERAQGNYTQAARLLGLRVTYLHRLVRNLNLATGAKHIVASAAR